MRLTTSATMSYGSPCRGPCTISGGSSPNPLDTTFNFWYNAHMQQQTPQQLAENRNYDLWWFALGRKVSEVAAKYGMEVEDVEMGIKAENARRNDIAPLCSAKATRMDIGADLLGGFGTDDIAKRRSVEVGDVEAIASQAAGAGIELPENKHGE